jgi:NAD(P)H-dependent FMN reductase
MAKILGLSGSLRRGSFNTGLLRAGVPLVPAGHTLTVHTIHGIPVYDGDMESESGIPTKVSELKQAIIDADGLVIATPEYNNSLAGPLKNAIDWATRPPADIPRVFGGKPVVVIGATIGGFGTILAQDAWLPVLRVLGMQPWFGGRLLVSRANTLFDEQGNLTDDKTRAQLRELLAGFVRFVEQR